MNDKNSSETFSFSPIGFFHTNKKYTYDAARQPVYDITKSNQDQAYIELNGKSNFQQALIGLEGFSHIWVIYVFHKNTNWNQMVTPPRGKKTGVFSTRSPHRPNPIGMSALRILSIENLRIYVDSHDLLDGTPVLDIKPYHIEADSIPNASKGWLTNIEDNAYQIEFSPIAQSQIEFLKQNGIAQLLNFIQQQLSYEPLNSKKKRVELTASGGVLAYRTWRVHFDCSNLNKSCVIQNISSGYKSHELSQIEITNDPYLDKHIHLQFVNTYCVSF